MIAMNPAPRIRMWWTEMLFPASDTISERMTAQAWLGLCLLVLVAGTLLFQGLSYPLLEPDEGRYAEIGREMAQSGDWVVPRFNREPYLDKPPLFYWLVGASVRLFGAHEWAVRLVPSLSTFLTILATFFFGRRALGTRRALLGTLALTLMGGVILAGRMLILDAVLTLWVVLALFASYEAVRGERLRKRWWLLSACFCALGVLAKGPVALALTAPPVLAYSWLTRQPGRPRLLHWILYGVAVLAVIAPWFVAISRQCPEFPYYFFVNQHLVRYLGQEHHPQPVWYYVPALLGGCLPWSLLFFPMGAFLLSRRPEFRVRRTRAMGFLLLCSTWCLAFFSASRGKLPPYILPAMAPLALLLGCYLEILFLEPSFTGLAQHVHRHVPRHTTSFLALAWVGLTFWSWQRGMSAPGRFALEFVEVAGCLGVFFGLLLYGSRLRPRPGWALCLLVMLGLLLEITASFLPAWSRQRSPFCRAREIQPLVGQRSLGVAFLPEFGSIPFRLSHCQWVHAPKRPVEEIKAFLGACPHSLLIADSNFPVAGAQFYLPANVEIERYFDSGKTRFFVLSSRTAQVSQVQRGPF
jgi:4-amino-4-deoxy-L-arabinose transferase-like glycosyltransferase